MSKPVPRMLTRVSPLTEPVRGLMVSIVAGAALVVRTIVPMRAKIKNNIVVWDALIIFFAFFA